MNKTVRIVIALALLAGLLLLNAAFFVVQETEQAIVTQFGRPVGKAITEAGLHMKVPFIQKVNIIPRVVMEWDGPANQIPTKDKLFIVVDIYARWRIKDPLLYFQTLRDEMTAQSRIDDILDGETRNAIAKHPLIEVIRNDKDRRPLYDEALSSLTVQTGWPEIRLGREKIAHEILVASRQKLSGLGLDLIDIRFKRINYNPDVQNKIYDRMVSERKQIAEKFRSEGQGEAARIMGERERDLKQIESEAYRSVQEIRGRADANATNIYARAYNQGPQAYDFFQFLKTMETYEATLDKNTTLILTTGGEFYRFLQNSQAGMTSVGPTQSAAGAAPPAPVAPQAQAAPAQ